MSKEVKVLVIGLLLVVAFYFVVDSIMTKSRNWEIQDKKTITQEKNSIINNNELNKTINQIALKDCYDTFDKKLAVVMKGSTGSLSAESTRKLLDLRDQEYGKCNRLFGN